MAVRDDITIDWFLSPRIIRVASPSTELTIQDLHDTARDIESRIENLIYNQIISTAGKEALGGGVSVGLTSTLLNAKIAFDARKISISSGTITSTDTTGRILTDGSADFISDGVESGAWIVNLTDDGSAASVISVLNSTQILTDILADGYDNQFDIGDEYKIWNVEQVNISGGNLVAVAEDGYTDISSVLSTMGTQVVRTSSSSATLQEILDIQHSSFNQKITVNVLTGVTGTFFPIGTPRQPVNNITDALTIATARGIDVIEIQGNATIANVDLSNKIITGQNPTLSTLSFESSANIFGIEIQNATIQGVFDGYALIRDCHINDITFFDGAIHDSLLLGTIGLNNTSDFYMINCSDGLPGLNTPTLDVNNSNTSVTITGYDGGISIINKSGNKDMTIDLNSGRVVLDSTVTNGTILVRGVGVIENSSTATVNTEGLTNPNTVSNATLKKTLPFLDD